MRLRFRPSPATHRTLEDSDVFLGFLCLYLLTAGRSLPFGDAVPMWEAAQNLVGQGTFAIQERWPVNAPRGADGHYYPVAALLACLVHVPGAFLQARLAAWVPARAATMVPVTSQLGPLIVGALTPMLFFRMMKQLGYERRQAALTTLLLGMGTSIWVYARRPYSEILQAACFIAFLGSLLGAVQAPTRTAWLRWGVAIGLLVNTKNVFFVCLPGALLFVVWRLKNRPRGLLREGFVWTAVGVAPGLIALAWYNAVRWGSITNSGYEAVTTGFWRENILTGLWGQLLSPGKSVFLYSPPLLLALFGLRRFWARRPEVAVAIALVVSPVVLLYARYLFWSGDWAWGPRYLVFALPALLLPAAELLSVGADAGLPPRARRVRRAGILAIFVAGVAVQGLGNAFVWDEFINISRAAQHAWLGRPDTSGNVLAPDSCFSCFEEVFPIEWLPPMQPISGHAWLLRHQLARDDWKTAEADAPWKRYTSLPLDIRLPYQAAQIDWWVFAVDSGHRLPALLVVALFLLAFPIRPWLGALRARSAPESAASP